MIFGKGPGWGPGADTRHCPEPLAALGAALLDFEERREDPREILTVDREVQRMLGWPNIPTDDDADPIWVVGVVEHEGRKTLVFAGSCYSGMSGDAVRFVPWLGATPEQVEAVIAWAEGRIASEKEATDRKRRIAALFVEHELDDASVARRRKELLKAHGLE